MRKKTVIFIFTIILIITGIYFYKDKILDVLPIYNSSRLRENAYAEKIDPGAIIEVKTGNIKKTVSTSGYIKPENEAYLSFATTGTTGGTVERIFSQRGELVERGQQLVKLEDKQEHLNYLKAKNDYELAKITGSPSQIEEAKLTMEVALDKYESKTLKAPFSGKIVDIFIEEGDFIEGSSDVVYIIDDSSYEVKVSVSEVDCLSVAVGQKVEIELDILKGQKFTGTVAEVAEYAKIESGVVTVPVTLLIDEVSHYFKPGFSATAEIIIDSAEDVMIIPITAISQTDSDIVVLKVEQNQILPTPVKVGISDSFYQEVTAGLNTGDKIIVNNYQRNNPPQNSRNPLGGIPMPRIRP